MFFGSVAFQLSQYRQGISLRIGDALELTPDASRDQLRDLIIQPLQSYQNKSTVLIVIDALDECSEQDAQQLLSILLEEIHKVPNLKLFFTTRPEPHILDILRLHEVHPLYRLHDIESSIVEGDIRSYLSHGLSPKAVKNALPELEPPPWTPSSSDFNALVNTSGKLFIIASTAIKFLLDDIRYNPRAQMADLMRGIPVDNTGANPLNALDGVYAQILRVAIPSNSSLEILSRFHSVVGTIVLLQDPLPLQALASLLQTDIDDVNGALLHLRSIIWLSGPENTPRLYHRSFLDFITDAERCSNVPRFHIPVGLHGHIARNCFRVMDEQLHANIRDLEFSPGYLDNDKDLMVGRISSELQYASLHWATHLCSAENGDDLFPLLEKFSFTHLLHWLEVLSLIGRLEVASTALDRSIRFAVSGFTQSNEPSI